MENKVYYGEYSLDYWIELILSKNIILPDYQRNFVWDEEKREKLIESLSEKKFVPPVIIGSFKQDGESLNLLIDGQQRLTSILLSVIGYFPDRKKFEKISKNKNVNVIDENDDNSDEQTDVINWTFNDLLKGGPKTILELKEELSNNDYFKKIDIPDNALDKCFLKNTFLGFSFIIPDPKKPGYQQQYYTSVFRNINVQGQSLTPQESREALYYLDQSKVSFFKPYFLEKFTFKIIDFVRYMAILSEYDKNPNIEKLCVGFAGTKDKLESYYKEYINFVIVGTEENKQTKENDKMKSEKQKFIKLEYLFEGDNYDEFFEELDNYIKEFGLYNVDFESIIDQDMYYFGLIYLVLFKKKKLKTENKELLFEKLKNKIEKFKVPFTHEKVEYENGTMGYEPIINYHPRNPSALTYLTKRVKSSIEIYKEVMVDN